MMTRRITLTIASAILIFILIGVVAFAASATPGMTTPTVELIGGNE